MMADEFLTYDGVTGGVTLHPSPDPRILKRLDDLEHDNNVLRTTLADLQRNDLRREQEWDELSKRINKLIATVNEFVGRFGVVN